MTDYIKSLIIFLSIGIVVSLASFFLESTFMITFLKANLVNLLVTLLAINTATLGLLSTKIHDVHFDNKETDFSQTINEMKKSLLEQVVLIILAIIVLILDDSKIIYFTLKELIVSSLLTAILAFDIYTLWDTGNAVFVLIDEIKSLDRK